MIVSMFALIRGDVRLVRVKDVFVLRMNVDPGFDPCDFDGMTVQLRPVGEGLAPVSGILRYHATSDERRQGRPASPPVPFHRAVLLSSGRRMIMRHAALSPTVRAVCAKTIGFQVILERPLTEEEANEGEVRFRLSGEKERVLRYISAPSSIP